MPLLTAIPGITTDFILYGWVSPIRLEALKGGNLSYISVSSLLYLSQ